MVFQDSRSIFHDSGLVFHDYRWNIMVIYGSSLVFMVIFHCSRLAGCQSETLRTSGGIRALASTRDFL